MCTCMMKQHQIIKSQNQMSQRFCDPVLIQLDMLTQEFERSYLYNICGHKEVSGWVVTCWSQAQNQVCFFVLFVFLCWSYNHSGVMCQDGYGSVNALVFKIYFIILSLCVRVCMFEEGQTCTGALKARDGRSSGLGSCV